MNLPPELDARLRAHLEQEAVTRAPDRVLDQLLHSIESTPQRRRRWMPWRYAHMAGPLKVAGATAIISLALIGALVIHPLDDSDTGGVVAPSASPGQSAAPSPTPIDTADWPSFTSARHGYSLRYPPTWHMRSATAPWVHGDPVDHDLPNDPATDQIDSPFGSYQTFWLASQAIPDAAASADPGDPNDPGCWPPIADWPQVQLADTVAHYHGGPACDFWETQVVDGGRSYAFASTGAVPLNLFLAVMSTITLDPASADDSPAASPSPVPVSPSPVIAGPSPAPSPS